MTRIERDTYRHSPCPCGIGEIAVDVVGTDYRHDKPKVSFRLECTICSQAWQLAGGGTLILTASTRSLIEAQTALTAALSARINVARAVVTDHLATATLPTKKAEWEYLSGLGLWNKSYRVYTTERRRRNAEGLADGFLNPTWLRGVASPRQRAELLRLDQLVEQLTEHREAARRLLVTWPTKSSP